MTQVASAEMIRSTLKSNICKVTFTKSNGELREMMCTLQESIVVPHEKTTDRVREVKEDVIPVWDCEKEAWRSFRIDSIIAIQIQGDINVPA